MFLIFLEPNKRGGWKVSQKSIIGEALIRVSRVEKFLKINKRACPFIRKARVSNPLNSHQMDYKQTGNNKKLFLEMSLCTLWLPSASKDFCFPSVCTFLSNTL